jgi:light-independent protochlorophyllide reductase subunit N
VVARLLERRPDIKLLFLVGSCPSEVIKLDLAARRRAPLGQHAPDVRILNYSGSGIETTFTQGEDACLAGAGPEPAGSGDGRAIAAVVGALADVVEDQFTRLFDASWASARPLPAARAAPASCRRSARHTLLLAQPFLGDTAPRAGRRGAQLIAAPFPFGAKARPPGSAPPPMSFGVNRRALRPSVTRAPRPRRARRSPATGAAGGKRIFFFPDSASWRSRSPASSMRELRHGALGGRHALSEPAHDGPELDAAAGRVLRLSEGQDVDKPTRPLPRRPRPISRSAASASPIRWRRRA